MPDIEILNLSPETVLYNSIHEDIEANQGRLSPAEICGILFQIQLEVMGVPLGDED